MQCFKVSVRNRLAVWFAVAVAAGSSLARADITYTLNINPSNSAQEQEIANSVAEAVSIYNTYGSFNKHWWINYTTDPGTTANANYEGWVVFGTQRTTRTALHEGAHTLGMGTTTEYANLISGLWRGAYGRQAELDTYNTSADGLHGDGHAIWPGGMNYESEFTLDWIYRVWMVRIQAALRCDMGILAYSKEAENELVHPGETAEFSVEAPVAASYQWYKGGVALANGGDISGANTATLRIANAEAADEGSYHCAATGAGETLNSRARQLWVRPMQQLGQWDLDGNVTDSVNTNNGTSYGSPTYPGGMIGQAINLDGIDDYVQLPAGVGMAKDITVATWVNWDGGDVWQRIFDFGTGTYQYMFLTPKSGDGTLRLAFRDAVNGVSSEQRVDTAVLPTGQWVHLAAVLHDGLATLYVNGHAVGSTPVPVTDPIDFPPTQNYIGKSQFNDSLFDGRIDDFRVYNYALDGSEIWGLWGQNADTAPVFSTHEFVLPGAVAGHPFVGTSLTEDVDDADGDTLSFSRIDGPAWLTVAGDGSLSGNPGLGDAGMNIFHVRVQDPDGASSDAKLVIDVEPNHTAGPVAYWDFADAGAANDAFMPGNGDRQDLDADGAMDSDDFRISSTDLSGNGNHLTAWTSSWMKWSSVSTLGDFSMIAANGYPASGTDSIYDPSVSGIDAEAISPAEWTVEAEFRPTALGGNQTVVGRDGVYTGTWGKYAALYLSTRGTDLAIEYVDAAMNHHNLQVAAGLANNTWYHVAATSDGSTLRLWLNGSQIGTLNVSGSANSALAPGHGIWSVARGMFDAGHVDRFSGYVDAVAVSAVALAPGSFVITGTWPSGYDFYVEDYGIPGASFEGDWNSNGVANGMEYYLGWDPTDPLPAPSILTWSGDLLSVSFPFNPSASGVTGTADLASGVWTDAGVTYATNTSIGEIEANLGTAATNQQLFLRFKVQQ